VRRSAALVETWRDQQRRAAVARPVDTSGLGPRSDDDLLLVDGTPLLDLKPYVARFDEPRGRVRSGWFDTVTFDDAVTPNQLRPPPAASGR
jgi:hypothetical protein